MVRVLTDNISTVTITFSYRAHREIRFQQAIQYYFTINGYLFPTVLLGVRI